MSFPKVDRRRFLPDDHESAYWETDRMTSETSGRVLSWREASVGRRRAREEGEPVSSGTPNDGAAEPIAANGVPTVDGAALVDAVRGLDGVTDAAIAPDSSGNHALRLTLADGVDDAAVAA